jgi:hypothetical protein
MSVGHAASGSDDSFSIFSALVNDRLTQRRTPAFAVLALSHADPLLVSRMPTRKLQFT